MDSGLRGGFEKGGGFYLMKRPSIAGRLGGLTGELSRRLTNRLLAARRLRASRREHVIDQQLQPVLPLIFVHIQPVNQVGTP
jgi:hypothetical protein